jgi:chromosome segregation ATPase
MATEAERIAKLEGRADRSEQDWKRLDSKFDAKLDELSKGVNSIDTKLSVVVTNLDHGSKQMQRLDATDEDHERRITALETSEANRKGVISAARFFGRVGYVVWGAVGGFAVWLWTTFGNFPHGK